MDKGWMNKPRNSEPYLFGVEKFLDFAFANQSRSEMILCPCTECKLGICVKRNDAREHLIVKGFIKGYNDWVAHGEVSSNYPTSSSSPLGYWTSRDNDDMHGLVHDAFGIPEHNIDPHSPTRSPKETEFPTGVAEKFYKLIDESQNKLYDGCENFTKLSFIIRLLHIKCLGKWSNKHFDMLLELLREAFPEAMTNLPKSYYDSEKLMKDLGIGYEKIDACPNDCTLYWGVNKDRKSCVTCNKLRWRKSENDPTGEKRKIAEKVLWHFPIKPRLQRLFMSSKTACHMQWHAKSRTKDGHMRHPGDSPAWQTFDSKYPEFANDPRNVRLGLASDGFNPFSNMNVNHSTWPVILIPYNLPPWMCMKQSYFLLSLLIPGPSAPGNNIDIYLQPLISDLKDLWEVGIDTYDASTKSNFQMRASLLWTISDFPGYANLSGWSTKGKFACPVCHKFTCSYWLAHGGKFCYMDHRRFLDKDHAFRKNTRLFNGSEENRRPPPRLSGQNVLEELKDINFIFGKNVKNNPDLPFSWKKKSIFFELPYWKDCLVRHNLDFMHIEKNVCESICSTLLQIDGKTKDNIKSRLDLKLMGIRPELHPEPGKKYLPPASFTMDKREKSMFCHVLEKVKVPDGYAANISRWVQLKPPKLVGLKSHDYHILMQQLLPVALRKTLPKSVRYPLIRLSRYFRELCSTEISPLDVVRLEKEIAVILCDLEKIFPPSFFDVMVHLTIHLATEVKLAGPVHYRWMYPIERYLGTLKSYVRNRSRPEGSIAQGYVAEECLTFCSLYLADYAESKFNKATRNENVTSCSNTVAPGLDVFTLGGYSIGKGTPTKFDDDTLKMAHQYVLFNCETVKPYIQQHHAIVEENHPHVARHQIERIHSEQFAKWFSNHVKHLQLPEEDPTCQDLKLLACGPDIIGLTYDKYIVNGFRFHTKEIEVTRKTQNSGVTVKATTPSFSSVRDENPILGELEYYGVLTDIIELRYMHHKVVLFGCDWVSKGKRLRKDSDGFTVANFTNVKRHEEPFILASQATQVFYIADPVDNNEHVVISTVARGVYNMQPLADVETYLQSNICNPVLNDESEEVSWVREDVEGV